MFKTSEKTDLLDASLAIAQGQIAPAVKDANNPHYKSKYADLAGVMEVSRTALASNGLSVTCAISTDVDRKLVSCGVRVGHKSGQWIEFPPLSCQPARGIGPQDVGAAATYLRRYAICAALNIVTDDDDGETASGRGQYEPPKPAAPKVDEQPDIRARSTTEMSIEQRVAIMVARFAELGVDRKAIESEVGCPIARFEPIHLQIASDYFNQVKKTVNK